MTGALQLAISSKINDRDDFRCLVLKSDDGAEVYFRRDASGQMVCQRDGAETYVPDDEALDAVDKLVQRGFSSLTCECWSRNVHIDVSGNGKIKMRYSEPVASGMDEAKHLIDPEEAIHLLQAIEIVNPDGYMSADMRRKYVQVDNFVKLIRPLLSKSTKEGKIFILDCGSGKSYLSFVMNYFIREKLRRSCHFFCIDENEELMHKGMQIRDELGYDNMEFFASQIREFEPPEKVDIVCSLHACDTASDEAIAKVIQLEAKFLLAVPCCQNEVVNQLKDHPLKAITRHGTYKARLADLLTDAMRTLILEAAGYKVSVTEYVSPTYTPKNIMIQAEKVQSKNKMALEQYLELKAMFGGVSLELEKILRYGDTTPII